MGGQTTTYDVVTRYMMETSGAGPKLAVMERQMRQASSASDGLQSGLRRLGMYAAGAFGLHEAGKALVGYNSYMEQSRIQMAGLMAQAGSGDFVGNLDKAALLMRQMRDDAAKTVGTTQDYVAMASQLVQPLTMAGAGLEDIRELTRLAVVGSRAMGIDMVVAARDVDQAIRGTFRSVDQFTGKLLVPMGFAGEEGHRRFNALTMEERFRTVQKSLKSKAIEDMAQAQETTFEGVFSTFQSIVSQTLGSGGMPIFKAITAELLVWNTWLQQNEKRVEEIATSLGSGLLTGMRAVKDVTIFIHDHWKAMALLYAEMKIGGMVGGLMGGGGIAGMGGIVGGVAGGASGLFGILRSVFQATNDKKITGNLEDWRHGLLTSTTSTKAYAAQLGIATVALTGFAVGLKAFADWQLEGQSGRIGRQASQGAPTMDAIQNAIVGMQGSDFKNSALQARIFRQNLVSSGLAGEGGVNGDALKRALGENGGDLESWGKRLGLKHQWESVSGIGGSRLLETPYTVDQIAAAIAAAFKNISVPAQSDMWSSPWRMPGMKDVEKSELDKPKVNVTINRIEITTQDPDVFAFEFVEGLRDAARNPSSALHALREG